MAALTRRSLISLFTRSLKPQIHHHRLTVPLLSRIGSIQQPTAAQTRFKSTSGSGYSPLNDPSPNWSNRPPKDTIMLDGCDYEHWLIDMEFPENEKLSEEEMVNSYVKTLAAVVGSEEEAKKKIYSVCTTTYTGFGALISEELSHKVKGLPGVLRVLPEYLDIPNEDYGVAEMAEQNVQRRDRRSPRIWSSHAMSAFFRIAADAYQAAGQSKKGIHKKIMIELNEALVNVPGESPFTVEQVTAKYDALKKKWMVWRNLRNKTGAGWDNARGTISGSELWWIDRQTEFGNSVLKYKRQPIENLNELEQIFGNSVATGSSSKVRSSRRRRTENEEKMNELVDMMYEKHKNKKNRSETDSPSSNPSTNASSSPYANTSPQPTTPISDLRTTIERVKKFDDIQLSKAISLLQIKENRDTLTLLEDDDAREWLRYEIEKINLAMRYQQYMISMPPRAFTFPPNYPPTFPPTYPPQFPPNFPPQYPPQ